MVRIFGGEARGASAQDAGGSLLLQGGAAFAGSVRIAAGAGTATSSGSVLIETPNAGRAGVSGSITLRSGTTHLAGRLGLFLARHRRCGRGLGRFISLFAGSGNYGEGAPVSISAGANTDAAGASGGCIAETAGYSAQTSSGSLSLRTPNAGLAGVSGGISLSTGTSSAGNSGMIGLGTGEATGGQGGDVRVSAAAAAAATAATAGCAVPKGRQYPARARPLLPRRALGPARQYHRRARRAPRAARRALRLGEGLDEDPQQQQAAAAAAAQSAAAALGQRAGQQRARDQILQRCAEFFIKHAKFDKAAHLYITAGKLETALELCFNQKVTVTEDMAEAMTLEQDGRARGRQAGGRGRGQGAQRAPPAPARVHRKVLQEGGQLPPRGGKVHAGWRPA